jgi:hypothetical protein
MRWFNTCFSKARANKFAAVFPLAQARGASRGVPSLAVTCKAGYSYFPANVNADLQSLKTVKIRGCFQIKADIKGKTGITQRSGNKRLDRADTV